MGEPSPSSSFLALLFNTVFYMKNNPKYTFGDRIFVKNEKAEVLGIWRALNVFSFKGNSVGNLALLSQNLSVTGSGEIKS